MPYKNLEDKQRWERDHREQRNARRRRHHSGVQTDLILPELAHDPSFQKGMAPALRMASRSREVYVVAFLLVFLAGLGLATYFVRVQKTVANMPPDPIPAREPRRTWKIVGLGVCVLVVGLVVFSALGGVVRAE